MKFRLIYHAIIVLLFCLPLSKAHADQLNSSEKTLPLTTQSLSIDQQLESAALSSHMQWVEDAEHELILEQVMTGEGIDWQHTEDETFSFGFTDSTYWFKTELTNSSDKTLELFLELANPLTDWITFYEIKTSGTRVIQTGDRLEFSHRPIIHSNFIFPIEIAPNESASYIFKVRDTDEFVLTPLLWNKDTYVTNSQHQTLINGLFYGVMMIMAIYNLIILIITRKKAYFYYVSFVISTALFIAVQQGYAFQYLWPNALNWNGYSDPVMVLVATSIGYIFTNEVIAIKSKIPQLYRAMTILIPIHILLLISFLFIPLQVSITTAIVFAVPGAVACILAGFYLAFKGDIIARYYSIAWVGMIFGIVLTTFKAFGWVPYNVITANALPIGFVLEVALLSVALASQISRLEKEKVEAFSESKAKSEFLAKMSHEIRTPMNGVIGMAELLRVTPLSQTQKHYTDVIHSSGSALLSIINDILDYSKIEAGKMVLESIPFNLQELIENTLALFGAKANEKRVELLYRIDEKVPLTLEGDPSRLKQILINLIGNALKFTENGEIIVSVEFSDEQDSMVRFAVKDSGIGISEEAQRQLFSAFSQADASTARRFGGTGLGLAISKQLSALMNGEIGVESKLNEGSTFWFTARMFASATEIKIHKAEKLKGKRILVIDDNEAFCEVITSMCKSFGMETEIAYSAEQALHQLSKAKSSNRNYDLVSLDLYMPVTNGLLLARQIRERNLTDAKFILISSTPDAPENTELEELEIGYRLEKPVLSQNLQEIFCRALGFEAEMPNNPEAEVIENAISLNILVAEDNKTNQMVISSLLKKLGHTFQIADDGRQAIEALQQSDQEFDLVLMDCEMPEMDGWEATSIIRSWDNEMRSIPIIAATAHAVPELINRCLTTGMTETLCKPIRIQDLKKVLSHYSKRYPAKAPNQKVS